MKEPPQTISIYILDKEYHIACPPDEVDALMESAAYLDHRMRDIKKNSSVYGLERVAIMAALNITNEYLSSSQTKHLSDEESETLKVLAGKVEHAIKRLRLITH